MSKPRPPAFMPEKPPELHLLDFVFERMVSTEENFTQADVLAEAPTIAGWKAKEVAIRGLRSIGSEAVVPMVRFSANGLLVLVAPLSALTMGFPLVVPAQQSCRFEVLVEGVFTIQFMTIVRYEKL